jgi:hypothetical protein
VITELNINSNNDINRHVLKSDFDVSFLSVAIFLLLASSIPALLATNYDDDQARISTHVLATTHVAGRVNE